MHFITLIAYPPFNGLLSIYSVASFCQLVSLFAVFLLFFLLSIVFCHRRRLFFSPKKLWNFHAINLSSCFGQSFVCLLQAHFHCRSRLYYWLNEISITKKNSTKRGRVQHATAKNKVPPHFC